MAPSTDISGGGSILTSAEENNSEVRLEDQESINRFGRLNARLYEVRDERDILKVILRYDLIKITFSFQSLVLPSRKLISISYNRLSTNEEFVLSSYA